MRRPITLAAVIGVAAVLTSRHHEKADQARRRPQRPDPLLTQGDLILPTAMSSRGRLDCFGDRSGRDPNGSR